MAINSRNGNTLLETGFFPPCRTATSGSNIVLSGLQTLGGVVLIAGDRVLVKNQTDAKQNGIYAASSGNWVRTTDAASNTQFFDGMAVIVAQGTVAGTIWLCTTTDDPVLIGTSLITFALQAQGTIAASPQLFDTRALAAAAAIPASINFVRTAGCTSAGDLGSALYSKAGGSTTGGFQSADGQWWQLAEAVLNPFMLAAAGGGADDTTPVQNALNLAGSATGRGAVYIPRNLTARGGLTMSSTKPVQLFGPAFEAAALDVGTADVTLLAISNAAHTVRDLILTGSTTVGTSQPTLNILPSAVETMIDHCEVFFGQYGILVQAPDTRIVGATKVIDAYGSALIRALCGCWLGEVKLDQSWPGATPTTTINAWAGTTGYVVGNVVSLIGYYIQCTHAGTSGGSAPTLQPYGTVIVDGTAQWQLAAPATYYALQCDTGCLEAKVSHGDFSGAFTAAIALTNTLAGTPPGKLTVTDSVLGALTRGIACLSGSGLMVSGCEIGTGALTDGGIVFTGAWTGTASVVNNMFFGAGGAAVLINAGTNHVIADNTIAVTGANGVSVSAGIGDFIIEGNAITGAGTAVTVNAGASNHYNIVNNLVHGCAGGVSDGGAGVNKTVSGNN